MKANKEARLLTEIGDLYRKMAWLNSIKLADSFKGYKSSEIHCIEYIGNNAECNVTKLAESFYMTRGAISKMTQKLIKKEIIESYQKSDNKKEIYFSLTEKGTEIYKIHAELHNEFSERDKAVFDQITDEQLEIMLNFVKMYSEHLDKEIQKEG